MNSSRIQLKQLVLFIFKLVKPYRFAVFVMFLVALIWGINLSVNPLLIKSIFNRLSGASQTNVLTQLAIPILLYLSMNLVLVIAYRLQGYFVDIKMVPAIRKKIQSDALNMLFSKDHNYYQDNFAGNLANKISDLEKSIPELAKLITNSFISHLIGLVIAIITLAQVSKFFGFLMFGWSLSAIIIALIASRHLNKLSASWSELSSIITGKIVDSLSNILSVRLFAGKNYEHSKFSEGLNESARAEQKLEWINFWLWSYYALSTFFLQILNLYLLCRGRQEGWITVGDFALVLTINFSVSEFIYQITEDFSRFSKLYGRATQALGTILEKTELVHNPDATELKIRKGSIVFENVSFGYKNSPLLFSDQSLRIEGGTKVGLVGYSGGGKSTFMHLILRLYDLNGGCILIDDQDISHVTEESLHLRIATIPQEPGLFHRSLMENIRYGRPLVSDDQVIEASKKAYAHDFISKLPLGYQSLVGERSVKLSGGQRQRIAIARAILKNAPILILDEATSQLDSITEKQIQESLWPIMDGRTTIVIAHRLSTLLHMDRILVFDQGKIIEDGSHDELLNLDGLYKKLWEAQAEGFLGDGGIEGS